MNQDPVRDIAGKWFKKLNSPLTATFRITHARRGNSALPFQPSLVLEQYRKTSEQRMERLADAVKDLSDPPDSGAESR
jgi:hypothetical protein